MYEINNLFTEEILPNLEKLRKEHVNYVQWENNNEKLEVVGTRMYEMTKEYIVLIIEKKTKLNERDSLFTKETPYYWEFEEGVHAIWKMEKW